MAERTKILLMIPHLGGGGAERVIALLARGLSREKYEVHLALITQAGPSEAEPGEEGVIVHALGAARVSAAALRVVALVRRIKPRVILPGMFHLNFLVLLLRPLFPGPVRIVVRQNGFVSAVLANGQVSASNRILYRFLYRTADRVLCQSQAMSEDMIQVLAIPEERIAVLHNPVDVDTIRGEAAGCSSLWAGPGPHLLAVGRLSAEKGFDLLLTAVSDMRSRYPQLQLTMCGTGPEDAALQSQCRALALEGVVSFAGHVDRPCRYFPGADAFVLSSRHDAMPNALLEAAAAGLPIIALPAAGGVPDLLRGQAGTWVAAEISARALAETLRCALETLTPGQRFPHAFVEPFRMDRAIDAYEAVIDATLPFRES